MLVGCGSQCSHVCLALFKKRGHAFVSSRVYMDMHDDMMNVFVDRLRRNKDVPRTKHFICLRGKQQKDPYIGVLRAANHGDRFAPAPAPGPGSLLKCHVVTAQAHYV